MADRVENYNVSAGERPPTYADEERAFLVGVPEHRRAELAGAFRRGLHRLRAPLPAPGAARGAPVQLQQ